MGCVEVFQGTVEDRLFDDSFGRAYGLVRDVEHPTFGEHPRLAPYLQFSRSATQALPGVLAGQSTDRILSDSGRSADEIESLRQREIVA